MVARLLALQVVVNFVLLATAVTVPLESNLNHHEASGLWLPIASAHRGRQATELEEAKERSPFTISTLCGGRFELKFHMRKSYYSPGDLRTGSCIEKRVLLDSTENTSIFSYSGNTTAYVVATDYRNYIISVIDKNDFAGLYLAGRTCTLGPFTKLVFLKLALCLGFPADRIRDIKRDERCKPES